MGRADLGELALDRLRPERDAARPLRQATVARLIASRSVSLGSGLAAGRPRPSSPPAWFWPASWPSFSWRGSFDVAADRTPARTFAAHSCLAPAIWGFGLFGGFHSLPTREFAAGRSTCVRVRTPVQRLKQNPETSQTPIRTSEDRRIGGPCLKRVLVAVRVVGLHHKAGAIDDPAGDARQPLAEAFARHGAAVAGNP